MAYDILNRDPYIRKLESERWIIPALFQILKEHNIHPSSTELIAAKKRADQPPDQPPSDTFTKNQPPIVNLINSISKVIESTRTGDYADRYLVYEMRIALADFLAQTNYVR